MAQCLHPVFGGEPTDPGETTFRVLDDSHIVGTFPGDDGACAAWKAEVPRSVDNAHMRHSIALINRRRDESAEASSTGESG